MKLRRRDIPAVLVLIGLIILGCTYYFGYLKINNETAAIESRNITLKAQADAYEILYLKAASYNEERSRMENELPGMEDKFVYGISTQDEIIYVNNLESAQDDGSLKINYLNMASPVTMPYTPAIDVDPAFASGAISMPTVADDGVTLSQYSIDYGCEISYQGFKEMVNYLNTIWGVKKISSVTLSFDSSTGLLNGVIGVDMYALLGTDREYSPLPIPKVDTGVENIFGTVEIIEDVEPEEAEPEPEPEKTTKKKK